MMEQTYVAGGEGGGERCRDRRLAKKGEVGRVRHGVARS